MFICWLKLADISRCIRTRIKICLIKNAVWKNQKSYKRSIKKYYKNISYSRINADTFLVYNLDHKFQNYDVSIHIYGAVKGNSWFTNLKILPKRNYSNTINERIRLSHKLKYESNKILKLLMRCFAYTEIIILSAWNYLLLQNNLPRSGKWIYFYVRIVFSVGFGVDCSRYRLYI